MGEGEELFPAAWNYSRMQQKIRNGQIQIYFSLFVVLLSGKSWAFVCVVIWVSNTFLLQLCHPRRVLLSRFFFTAWGDCQPFSLLSPLLLFSPPQVLFFQPFLLPQSRSFTNLWPPAKAKVHTSNFELGRIWFIPNSLKFNDRTLFTKIVFFKPFCPHKTFVLCVSHCRPFFFFFPLLLCCFFLSSSPRAAFVGVTQEVIEMLLKWEEGFFFYVEQKTFWVFFADKEGKEKKEG